MNQTTATIKIATIHQCTFCHTQYITYRKDTMSDGSIRYFKQIKTEPNPEWIEIPEPTDITWGIRFEHNPLTDEWDNV